MPYKDKQKQQEYQRQWLKNRRKKWIDKNGPCKLCGSDINLEVDHKDRSIKVDHKVWSWSLERADKELKKCQVLCKKCHRKKTTKEISKPLRHGINSGYTNYKCRCRKCKDAHNKWNNKWWRKNNGRMAELGNAAGC